MIVQPFGANSPLPNLAGSTLVLSAGMSPFIALDMYILNEGMQKIGYYKSEYIAAGLSNDGLSVNEGEGALTLPAEVFFSAERKMTFLIIRSGVYGGKERLFGKELIEFIKKNGFSNIIILTSTLSPVSRERDTNRLIPEVFAYVNKYQLKQQPGYYEEQGIQKFGNWLKDTKMKEDQELDELMMGGSAKSLIKLFDKVQIPAQMFVIFTPGGIDFVGGYSYYQFLRHSLVGEQSSILQNKLGKLNLNDVTGEGIHEKLFVNKELKTPAYWKQIVSYF